MTGRPGRELRAGVVAHGVLVLGVALALRAPLLAQEAVAPQAPPTSAAITARIQAIEGATDIDAAVRTRALELLRQALTHANDHEGFGRSLQNYRDLGENGAARVKELREQLAAPPARVDVSALRDASLERLQALATPRRAELVELRGKIESATAAIAAQQDRPAKLREELTRAKERLKTVETELQTPAPADEPPVVAEARTSLLGARRAARTAEIQALEQESVVYETRLELLKAERDLDQRRLAEGEEYLRSLDALIASARQAEAGKLQAEAEQARQEAEGKHPALLDIATENERLGGVHATLTESIERATRKLRSVESKLSATGENFANAKKRLEAIGLSDVLGEILLDQREDIPDLEQFRRLGHERKNEIARLRVEQIRLDESRRALAEIDREAERVLRNAEPPVLSADVPAFTREVTALLRDRLQLIQKVDSSYTRYVTLLGDVDYQEAQLAELYSKYAAFLDENLLWSPSAPVVGFSVFEEIPRAVAIFLSPDAWASVLDAFLSGLSEQAVLGLFGSLVALILLLGKRALATRIVRRGERVGKKYADGIIHTIMALFYTVLIALPVPLAIGLFGWITATSLSAGPFALAIGRGVVAVSTVFFVLAVIHGFSARDGVAAVHLKWDSHTLTVIRRNIFWLVWLGLPLVFIVSVTEALGEDVARNSIGRLAFVCEMLVVSVFAFRVLHPSRGALSHALAVNHNTWLYRLRHLWFSAAVILPIAIAILALTGYYYTALQLDHRVFITVLIVFGAAVAYHLIVRWLIIARRRLALVRAKEKREAELAARGEEADHEAILDLDVPEIDLVTIKRQTHGVFRTAILIAALVSLATVWSSVLPALGVFNLELWRVASAGGETTFRSITVASLCFAIAVTAFAFIASKNLPGLLEVSALRKLPIDPGSRYAISTIGQYLLLAAGLVASLQLLGVAWSNVQWLIAALSVGLGFGLQEIFANFVSGLIILLERPIRVGDTVTIGDISGTVSKIRIRATTITDWDQKELVVPNKSFITGQLVNWSLSSPVTRLIVRVGIEYGSDTESALKLMYRATEEHPRVLEDPEPAVFFVGFGESSLDFEVRVFVKELSNRGRTRIVHDLHMAIDRLFRAHDIVIAFPQRDVHIKNGESFPTDLPAATADFEGASENMATRVADRKSKQ